MFNGPVILAVTATSGLVPDLSMFRTRGVLLLACNNSMAAASLSGTDLMPGLTVIPAGISDLVRRQHDGWAYVRP